MAASPISGISRLVEELDGALLSPGDTHAVTRRVKEALTRVISNQEVELPEEIRRPRMDCYARRLLHRNADLGYEAIAMIWGPNQGTPLHDHAGIWCVEGVLEGEIEVCQYDLLRREGDRFQFRLCDKTLAHIGMSGCLIPPYEYHTIANRLLDDTSITIHVYGLGMDFCHVFEPLGDGCFQRVRKELTFR